MCGLTTKWILEKCPKSACALIRTFYAWSGELLIPRSERELRRSEGSGTLIDDPLVEGSNAGSTNRRATYHRALGGGENSDAQTGAACS